MGGHAPYTFRYFPGARKARLLKIPFAMGLPLVMLQPVKAMVMPHVFKVDLPVSHLAARPRARDIQRAAGILLDRITGDPELAARGTVSALIAESGQWVAEYGYKEVKTTRENPVGISYRPPFRLWIRFDHHAVERAVLGAHLPFWGNLRPRILIWLDPGSSSTEILSASSPSPLRRRLKRALGRLALPALLPIMDLRERTKIGVRDLFPPAWAILNRVSHPYHVEALWVGRLEGSAARGWMGHFAFQIGRFNLDWQSQHPHVHRWGALQSALDYLDSILAARYAVFASHQPTRFVIRIRGHLTLERVSLIEHFLYHLPGVEQPRLSALAPKSLTMTLISRIDQTHLERLMTLIGGGFVLKRLPGHRLLFDLRS